MKFVCEKKISINLRVISNFTEKVKPYILVISVQLRKEPVV